MIYNFIFIGYLFIRFDNNLQGLYSGKNSYIHQSVIDFFLAYVEPNPECSVLMENLLSPITEDEVYDAINTSFNGRAPGPDGISNEFYKTMFPCIKRDLIQLFNFYLNNGNISSKMKYIRRSLLVCDHLQ